MPGVNRGDPSPGEIDTLDDAFETRFSEAAEKQEKLSVGNVSDEKLINIIGQLMATYKKCVEGQIEMEPLEHTVINTGTLAPNLILTSHRY